MSRRSPGLMARVSFDCKSRSSNPLLPPAELTNLVAVVDTVGKDLDLHQRLTSTVNQLVREKQIACI